MTATMHTEASIGSVLTDCGWTQASDGWFYPPAGIDRALVRISLFGGQYQIFRRRRVEVMGWTPILVDDCESFNADRFKAWQATWPLSC